MKRVIISVLFILYFTGMCTAAPLVANFSRNNQLERIVEQRAKARKQATLHKPPQKNTKGTPQKPANPAETWYGVPVITWEEYERASQQTIEKQKKIEQLSNEAFLLDPSLSGWDLQAQQGTPGYVKAVANTRYIYIGEQHDTPIVQEEIKKLIRAVRQANPGKKILLATEFLTTKHPLINPLHKNGTEWILAAVENNYNIPELADQLHMDTLALDDVIVQIQAKDTLLKVGNRYVKADDTNPKVQALLLPFKSSFDRYVEQLLSVPPAQLWLNYLGVPDEKVLPSLVESIKEEPQRLAKVTQIYGPGNEIYILLNEEFQEEEWPPTDRIYAEMIISYSFLLNTLQASTWGVLQRNYQWAQRIKKVANNYDVIIVWGGRGHLLQEDISPSVPMLLNEPSSINFSFYALDPNSVDEEARNGLIQRGEVLLQQQLDYCATESEEVSLAMSNAIQQHCQGLRSVDWTKPFFIKTKRKTNTSAPQKPNPQIEALTQQIKQLSQSPVAYGEEASKEFYQIVLK